MFFFWDRLKEQKRFGQHEKPSHPARRSSSLATRSSGTWGGSPSRGVQMSRSVEPREPLSPPSSPTERWWPSRTHEARGQPAAAAGAATLGGGGREGNVPRNRTVNRIRRPTIILHLKKFRNSIVLLTWLTPGEGVHHWKDFQKLYKNLLM